MNMDIVQLLQPPQMDSVHSLLKSKWIIKDSLLGRNPSNEQLVERLDSIGFKWFGKESPGEAW